LSLGRERGLRLTRASLVRLTAAAVAAALLIAPRCAVAQSDPAPSPAPSEHSSEETRTTWAGRVKAAWDLSDDHKWKDAEARFDALHHERPDAVDPLIGLGVVARGEGRYGVARQRFREALAIDSTSEKAKKLLKDAEWDRPLTLELEAGSSATQGSVTGTSGANAVVPVNPTLSLTGRMEIVGGGDAIRGVFLNPASAAVRQYVVSAGVIARPTESLTLTARGERWMPLGDTAQNYLYLEGALETSDHLVVHATASPIAARNGSPQFGGAVEYTVRRSQVLGFEFSQGIRQAEFDARTVAHVSYAVDPSRSIAYEVGVVRDIDRRFSATTGIGSFTWYARPAFGIHSEVSDREGQFASRSATAGIVLRW